ncbi:hypothetical protein NX059_000911 [Plenodomus lindquistii]|nr:hypothetical protein NX059_000911 [Plenodomus lindquistii]
MTTPIAFGPRPKFRKVRPDPGSTDVSTIVEFLQAQSEHTDLLGTKFLTWLRSNTQDLDTATEKLHLGSARRGDDREVFAYLRQLRGETGEAQEGHYCVDICLEVCSRRNNTPREDIDLVQIRCANFIAPLKYVLTIQEPPGVMQEHLKRLILAFFVLRGHSNGRPLNIPNDFIFNLATLLTHIERCRAEFTAARTSREIVDPNSPLGLPQDRISVIDNLELRCAAVTGKSRPLLLDTLIWEAWNGNITGSLHIGFYDGCAIYAYHDKTKHARHCFRIRMKGTRYSIPMIKLHEIQLSGAFALLGVERVITEEAKLIFGSFVRVFAKAIFALQHAMRSSAFRSDSPALALFKKAVTVINEIERDTIPMYEYQTFTRLNGIGISRHYVRGPRRCRVGLVERHDVSLTLQREAAQKIAQDIEDNTLELRPEEYDMVFGDVGDSIFEQQGLIANDMRQEIAGTSSSLTSEAQGETTQEAAELLAQYIRTLYSRATTKGAKVKFSAAIKKYDQEIKSIDEKMSKILQKEAIVVSKLYKALAAGVKEDTSPTKAAHNVESAYMERIATLEKEKAVVQIETAAAREKLSGEKTTRESLRSDATKQLQDAEKKIEELTARKTILEVEGGFELGRALERQFPNIRQRCRGGNGGEGELGVSRLEA